MITRKVGVGKKLLSYCHNCHNSAKNPPVKRKFRLHER